MFIRLFIQYSIDLNKFFKQQKKKLIGGGK